jgi:L-alanine-DL-glutamate epimerase-like enolase superfamily enzyme
MTKLESIEVVPTTLPDMFGEQMHLCLVRVEAEGVVGWGEICDSYCCTFPEVYLPLIDHVYAPLIVGSELVGVDALTRKLRMWARRRIGDAGLAIQALSGLELALWDLHGKLMGQSVSQLIGQTRDRIPVYASGKFLDEPIDMHVRILTPAIERGVGVAKVRTSLDPDADLAVLHQLRAELPSSMVLMVDGNENFSVTTALRLAGGLADEGVMFFEEPVPQVYRRAVASVVRRAPLPIAYGEHLFGAAEFGDALADGWPHIVQPDPSIAGGLSECLQVAAIAETYGVPVMPHAAAGPLAMAAGLHLAAVRQNVQLLEHAFTLEPMWEVLVGPGLSCSAIADGTLAVPSAPGLGIEIDEDALRAHPYQPKSYDMTMPRRSMGVI